MNGKEKISFVHSKLFHELLYLIVKILFIFFICVFCFKFIFGIYTCKSVDMHPALELGDLIVVYRLDKSYTAGTLIALKNGNKVAFLRVVAVSGDTVDMSEDGLIINGSLQEEPYAGMVTMPYEEGIEYPVTLRTGEVFVLGDNRSEAEDSRIIGVVKIDDSLGTVMTVVRRRNF